MRDAEDIRLHGADRIELIMNRRGETSEVVDRLNLEVDRVNDIMPNRFEPGMLKERFYVPPRACEVVVERENLMPFHKKGLAEMRTEKPGAACDQNPHADSFSIKLNIPMHQEKVKMKIGNSNRRVGAKRHLGPARCPGLLIH